MRSETVLRVATILVFLSWGAFCLAFLFRKSPPKARVAKRDTAARWGIALQAVGYFLAWSLQRAYLPQVLPLPRLLEIALAIFAVPLAAVSAWVTIAAVHTLGAQWSYEARLTEGHRLIVAGPYSYIRHPIYSAMLGLLIATGIVISDWIALVLAILLFGAGTAIRVRAEERLLRQAFGEDFEAYARHVPAILPRFRTHAAMPPA
jgi:protein-S-isoprenylcysteine O-methyltransferase Ste14